MINKQECLKAIDQLTLISDNDRTNYTQMCQDGVSIADLFRQEIPTKGSCSLNDANAYIKEEEEQMSIHVNGPYDMNTISVAEHVHNEDSVESEHAYTLYEAVTGDVKFFQEWLEGHHPSLACLYGFKNQVPPDQYYAELDKARIEAAFYRNKPVDYRVMGAGILGE